MTLRRAVRGATMFIMMMASSAACGGLASPAPESERVDRATEGCPPEALRLDDAAVQDALAEWGRASRDPGATRDVSVFGWMIQRDSRPLTVETIAAWLHETSSERPDRWILLHLSRERNRRWRIAQSFHDDGRRGIQPFEGAPTGAEAEAFFGLAGFDFTPFRGFRRIGAGVCQGAWLARFGAPPPPSFAVRGPDFLPDEARRSLAHYDGPTLRIEGRVLDVDGQPIARARIVPKLVPTDACCALSDRVETDAEGRFALFVDPREEENYALHVTDPSGASRSRFLGSGEREVTIVLPRESRFTTITLECEATERPGDGEVRVYTGRSYDRGSLIAQEQVSVWSRSAPYTISIRAHLPRGVVRVAGASACGTFDRLVDLSSSDLRATDRVTVPLPDASAHSVTFTLQDPTEEGGVGCLGLSSERYGAFQACTSATQLTLSGIHPGVYTVSRFDRSDLLSIQVPASETVTLPPHQPVEEPPDSMGSQL